MERSIWNYLILWKSFLIFFDSLIYDGGENHAGMHPVSLTRVGERDTGGKPGFKREVPLSFGGNIEV